MKACLDCVPCLIRQAVDAGRLITDDLALQEEIVRAALELVAKSSLSLPSPYIAQRIHRIVRQHTGVIDPYYSLKQSYNRIALDFYPKLKLRVKQSADPFESALRLAIASNVIDFGAMSSTSSIDVPAAIDEAFCHPIPPGDIAELAQAVRSARKILYLADNAGEIVFDRLLIEQMPRERVTVVVRGRPVLNDATLDDAGAAGLTEIVQVIGNGSDAPATILDDCSQEVKKHFQEADLVIAKGQGNYESLSGLSKTGLFFLLKVKCPVIARSIGANVSDYVVRTEIRRS